MGQNKAIMLFQGQPLIERVVSRLSTLSTALFITANQPDAYQFLGVPVFADILQGKGALGGLLTALYYAQSPIVAVVACDMPFVNPALLAAQRDLLVQADVDAVIPRTARGLEPLHAVYRTKTCLPSLRHSLDTGCLKISSWLQEIKLYEMDADAIAVFDPSLRSFMNLNTPEEFRLAEKIREN